MNHLDLSLFAEKESNRKSFDTCPDEQKTAQMCLDALEGAFGNLENVFEKIPAHIKTDDFYLAMSNLHMPRLWNCLKYIPEHLKTKEIELTAIEDWEIRQNPDLAMISNEVLATIPEEARTEKFYSALGRHARCFRLVPDEYKTEEMGHLAIEIHPRNVLFLPQKFLTQEFFLKSLNFTVDGAFWMYVPSELKTKDFIKQALRKSPDCIRYIPEEFKTKLMCRLVWDECLDHAKRTIQAPRRRRSSILALEARQMLKEVLESIPPQFREPDMKMKSLAGPPKDQGDDMEKIIQELDELEKKW
jgi:hypothetical protein